VSTPCGPRRADRRVRLLADEFAREWPGEARLEDLIHEAQAQRLSDGSAACWLIGSTDRDGKTGDVRLSFPIGLALVRPPRGGTPEFMIWLRGPYRGIGIARESLSCEMNGQSLIRRIARDLVLPADGVAKAIHARYPKTDPASRVIEKKLWLNFHYSHFFRAVGSVDVDPGDELIMRRELPTYRGIPDPIASSNGAQAVQQV
jgi:hypothetical protein